MHSTFEIIPLISKTNTAVIERGEAEFNNSVQGTQNLLFPKVSVKKCFVFITWFILYYGSTSRPSRHVFPLNLPIPVHAHTNFIVDRSVNKCFIIDRSVNKCFTVDRLRHRNGNEV
jgi:hypothetical protein